MHFVWSSAVKDLKRRARDPLALVFWLGIPIMILTLMTLAFGGSNGGGPAKIQAHMLVVDHDGSLLSRVFTGAFGQGKLAELIRLESVGDEADGRRRIDRGEATALLVIPNGFGAAVLRSQPTELQLWTNPEQRILPGIVEQTIGLFVDGTFYVQQLFGGPLGEIAAGFEHEFDLAQAAEIGAEVEQVIKQLKGRLSPPAIALKTSVIVKEEGQGSDVGFGGLLFPGVLFMAVFFVSQGLTDDIWLEHSNATLQRAMRIPGAATRLLAGKLVAGTLLLGAVVVLSLIAGALLFDLSVARLPLAALWTLVSGATFIGMFLLVQVYSKTQRAAVIVNHIVMFPLLILGGSLFPSEAMPAGVARVGALTPNGWALAQLKRILDGSAGSTETIVGTLAMLLLLAVFFFLVQRRVTGRFVGAA